MNISITLDKFSICVILSAVVIMYKAMQCHIIQFYTDGF